MYKGDAWVTKEFKEKYISKLKNTFESNPSTVELFLQQIENFCEVENNYQLPKHKYRIGDFVFLKKGTFLHGSRKAHEALGLILEHGFLSTDMYQETENTKTPWCASMWNIQNDILLKDYITFYSGVTIRYTFLDGKRETKVIAYNKFNEELESMKNSDFWIWDAEQTKEIRFMPSLAKEINQIAFIINTDNDYAQKLIKNDIFNLEFNQEILESFISEWFIKDYIYAKRDDFTTNRESAIIIGLPACLVEGILVGRETETNMQRLEEIKKKFPKAYVCNLDGKVIIE